MDTNFEKILMQSHREEKQKISRDLDVIMWEEYQIDDEMALEISEKRYQFPNAIKSKSEKRVLTRVEQEFSARKHVFEMTTYFHKHTFIELIYI